jgi:hypothetical protein
VLRIERLSVRGVAVRLRLRSAASAIRGLGLAARAGFESDGSITANWWIGRTSGVEIRTSALSPDAGLPASASAARVRREVVKGTTRFSLASLRCVAAAISMGSDFRGLMDFKPKVEPNALELHKDCLRSSSSYGGRVSAFDSLSLAE